MLKKNFRLFRILGVDVALHASALLLGLLVSWRLAASYFPATVVGLTASTYWSMGGLCALGLLLSILFHEIAHCAVARRFGSPMRQIMLFVFGGVATLDEEPRTAREEFLTAAAGPVCSLVVAAVLEGMATIAAPVAGAVLNVLAGLNLALAIFNLIPAFPLDGGRMLRAALWSLLADAEAATLATTGLGKTFGLLLSGIGALALTGGNVVDGGWQLALGLFLYVAARRSGARLRLLQTLRGRTVGAVVEPSSPFVDAATSLDEVAASLLRTGSDRGLAVTSPEGTLLGFIDEQRLMRTPRHAWPHRHALAVVGLDHARIASSADAWDAVRIVQRRGWVAVVDDGVLVGTLTMADLQRFSARYAELFGEPGANMHAPLSGLTTLARAARLLARLGSRRRDDQDASGTRRRR